MNYELCKKLKEAGFDQGTKERCYLHDGVFVVLGKPYPSGWEERTIAYPTLEELIEACGETFFGVYRNIKRNKDKGWLASAKDSEATGSTPEEAVANLWLSLKK